MDKTLQSKDKDWPNGYKNKTPIYAVYKRPISNLGTHTGQKSEDGKRYFMKWSFKKSRNSNTQTELKIKAITKHKGEHYIMIKRSIRRR